MEPNMPMQVQLLIPENKNALVPVTVTWRFS